MSWSVSRGGKVSRCRDRRVRVRFETTEVLRAGRTGSGEGEDSGVARRRDQGVNYLVDILESSLLWNITRQN